MGRRGTQEGEALISMLSTGETSGHPPRLGSEYAIALMKGHVISIGSMGGRLMLGLPTIVSNMHWRKHADDVFVG